MKKVTAKRTRISLLSCEMLRSPNAGFMRTSIFADVTLIRGETALMVYFMLPRDHSPKWFCIHIDFASISTRRKFHGLGGVIQWLLH